MNNRMRTLSRLLLLLIVVFSLSSCTDIFNDDSADPIPGSTPDRAILLIQDTTWKTGSLPTGGEKWYYFYALGDSTYSVYLDDGSSPSGKYNGHVRMTFYRPDLKTKITYTGGTHYVTDPYVFTALTTEKIYIQISPDTSMSSGSFALRVEQQSNLIE